MKYRVLAAGRSDIGHARATNQDAFLVRGQTFVVADGLGGHRAGDVASRLAIDVIARHTEGTAADIPAELAASLRAANEAIRRAAEANPAHLGMATTCTLMAFDGDTAFIAHVGDSRAYRLRGGQLIQLTSDHNLALQLVQDGRLSLEEVRDLEGARTLTRAIGAAPDLDVDILPVDFDSGDRFMICSDGLTSMLADLQIAALLSEATEPAAAAEQLIDAANEAGGLDNITVVVVDVRGDPA